MVCVKLHKAVFQPVSSKRILKRQTIAHMFLNSMLVCVCVCVRIMCLRECGGGVEETTVATGSSIMQWKKILINIK